MRFEVASHRVAQSDYREEHDQDSVQALRQVLREAAHGAAEPHHIKASQADAERRDHVDAPIPTMEGRALRRICGTSWIAPLRMMMKAERRWMATTVLPTR